MGACAGTRSPGKNLQQLNPRHSKRAVFTGASRNTGFEISVELARAGTGVMAVSRNSAGLERLEETICGFRGEIVLVPGDISTREGARKAAAQCSEIDILVNNTAMTNAPRNSFLELPDEVWDEEFAVNAVAPLTLMQALVRGMINRGGGSIINISSIAAKRPSPMHTAYAASKASLEIISKATAIELAASNARQRHPTGSDRYRSTA